MKPSLLFCSSLLLLLAATSCNSGNGSASSDSTTANASDSASPRTDTSTVMAGDTAHSMIPMADQDFLKNAVSGGLLEVELGKIAQQNASRNTVKNFGALMVKDHSMGGEELKVLAGKKNCPIPDSLSGKFARERDRFQKKTGNDFDKDYVNMMVDDHKDDIKEFEKEATDGKDPDVKAFAEKTLKMLHTHLDKVQAIQSAMK